MEFWITSKVEKSSSTKNWELECHNFSEQYQKLEDNKNAFQILHDVILNLACHIHLRVSQL